MAPPFAKISSAELDQFLRDVSQNVAHDDHTDFKKLVLYLFGFSNAKLEFLTSNSCKESSEIVPRLFSTIESVLSKKKHLLNLPVSTSESALVLSDSRSPFAPPNDGVMLYEWSASFAISWLSSFPHSLEITNCIKSFLLELIDIVAVHLHGLKHKKNLRTILLRKLATNIDSVFSRVLSPNDPVNASFRFSGPLLSATVHLFTVLNDHHVLSKLVLHTANYRVQFDSFARKLAFVISYYDLSPALLDSESNIVLLDTIKSVLLLHMTSKLLLDKAVCWSSVDLVLKWIHRHFSLFSSSSAEFHLQMVRYNKVTCGCLMKIYLFCRRQCTLSNFFSSFPLALLNVPDLTANVSTDSSGSVSAPNANTKAKFPPPVFKVLHLLNFQLSRFSQSKASQINPDAASPFSDPEFNELYDTVLRNHPPDLLSELSFIVDTPHSYSAFLSNKHLSPRNVSYDIKEWLNYVNSLLQADHNKHIHHIFENKITLFSFLSVLRNVPCIIAKDFDFSTSQCIHCTTMFQKNIYASISNKRRMVTETNEAIILYSKIICDFLLKVCATELQEDNLLASNFLLTLFNMLATFRLPDRDCKPDNPCLEYIIFCLTRSSNRDVRILAARALPLFLMRESDKQLDLLFKYITQTLSGINFDSSQGNTHMAESTLLAFAELAVVCEGEWLCVILIKLIDFLGQTNEQHVNIAYNTILYVASAKSLTPYKLLSPFLPSIAEIIIKKPRMYTKLTELLGISKKYFLSNTREYTTPRVLEYYKYDFIEDIAVASNMDKLKLITKMLPRIMATYLCKDDHIDAKYIVNVLSNASPSYRKVTISDLIPNVGAVLWYILLQMQMDDDGKICNESRIFRAIIYIAKINWRKRSENDDNSNPPDESDFDYVGDILREHVLELAQRFSEIVHQIKGIKPYLEKVSSIKAIQFLITKNTEAASWALGQISTCLQAALDSPSLEVHALQCWNTLVQKLDSRNLVSLFDISISLIFQKFSTFNHRSRIIAAEILKKIFKEISQKYNQYGPYYYSYSFIDDLDKYFVLDASSSSMSRLKNKISFFPELSRRIRTGNRIVVHQALDDLISYAKAYQHTWQSESLRDVSSESEISELVRNLLDTAVQFKSKDSLVSTKCATVLASLGYLDSNKFNFKIAKSQIIILYDFQDYRENARFLVDFIQNKVIKNFWASNDPIKQLFSVYSMQSFLSVLGLDSSILGPESQGVRSEVWDSFSEINKSTLTPLLSSRYFAQNPRYEPISFPYFRFGMKYEKWLIDITTNLFRRPISSSLMQRTKGNSPRTMIFQTCSMLIRDEEVSISSYLLKYVALSHVLNGDEKTKSDILTEVLAVLRTEASANAGSDRVENLKLCYQSVFEVIDYFNEWVSAATQKLSNLHLPKNDSSILKRGRSQVESFLREIPTHLIALTSSQCDSYERTILYLEKCHRYGKDEMKDTLDKINVASTLQSVYSNIDDYDALDGVLKKFSTNNLAQKLSAFQYNENWSIAQESFQVLSDIGSKSVQVDCNTKLFKSLADHALYDKVLLSLDSKIGNGSMDEFPMAWAMVGLQASLVSGEVNEIKKWRNIAGIIGEPHDVEESVVVKYADIIISLIKHDESMFTKTVQQLYAIVGQSLSSSMSSSFSRNTELLRQLHILYDTCLIVSAGRMDNLMQQEELSVILKERLKNTDPEFNTQWKILSMHKLCNSITNREDQISQIYLDSSRIARKDKRLDIATKSIIRAMVLNDQEANVEYAHLLWEQGKQTEAIKTLSESLAFGNSTKRARRQLQYALWLDESSHSSSSTIIEEYTKAYKLDKEWEKPFFDLGKYYSKIMEAQDDHSGFYEKHIIRFYLHALKLGTTYIYEALPKLITVWLDFAQRTHKNRDALRRLDQIVQDITKQSQEIPSYVWFTSITQLLSRITHSHNPTATVIMRIITTLVSAYPKHSLWYVLSHVKSKDVIRSERVTKILSKLQTNAALSSNINSAKELFEILERLAAQKVKKNSRKRYTLTEDFHVKDTKKKYDCLVIPVKSNLEIRIPSSYVKQNSGTAWQAFPRAASITFDGFDEDVKIFESLQMPKQITIRGSDNEPYRLMVKMDDTRKDAKVFEFTNMINRLLSTSTEARKRNLVIENYSVIPLAEDLGVIEFVHDVSTMKSVVHSQQAKTGITINEKKLFTKINEEQKMVKAQISSEPNAKANLVALFNRICEEVRPVLHQWFTDQFPDPAVWYAARKSFTRTAAVMSIVGYIIGLGDRHCENILFLKKNGSVLHIDFDCLFDKGATLPTPEIVPFRLTQNMVDAMGITGIEGTFRVTCEVTGSLLRDNEASLMNILETLIYDPLLDWKTHEKPKEHFKKVRRKIRGLLDEQEEIPMNVHGQVDVLIQQATSSFNLSQMYGGWAAYI